MIAVGAVGTAFSVIVTELCFPFCTMVTGVPLAVSVTTLLPVLPWNVWKIGELVPPGTPLLAIVSLELPSP